MAQSTHKSVEELGEMGQNFENKNLNVTRER